MVSNLPRYTLILRVSIVTIAVGLLSGGPSTCPCQARKLSSIAATSSDELLPIKGAYFYYDSGYDPSTIDATPLTHVLYAFALLDSSTLTVLPASNDGGQIQTFSSILKKSNPSLKTLISIGGADSDANAFSMMAASSSTRASFIASTIAIARNNSFDGLDLDWEFPQSDTDMVNLGTLFKEWREATLLENAQSPLLLSVAVKYNVTVMFGGAGTYPVAAMSQYLDFVNLMEYDLHGSWENFTGIHSAVGSSDPTDVFTADYGVGQWLDAGLPPSQAVFGMAMYGRTWILQNPSTDNGIGAVSSGAGPNDGVLTYDEIQQFKAGNGVVCKDDPVTMGSYCYGTISTGTAWVGYDETSAIAMKVEYLKSKGLRGYFFWNLASDRSGALSTQASSSLG